MRSLFEHEVLAGRFGGDLPHAYLRPRKAFCRLYPKSVLVVGSREDVEGFRVHGPLSPFPQERKFKARTDWESTLVRDKPPALFRENRKPPLTAD